MKRISVLLWILQLITFPAFSLRAESVAPENASVAAQKPLDSDNPHYRNGLRLMKEGEFKGAEPELKEAAKTIRNPHLFVALGNTCRLNGKLDESAGAYRRAIELDPGYTPAYSQLGYTLHLAGKSKEAEDCFRKALKIDPNYLPNKIFFAGFLFDRGNFKKAGELFDSVLKQQPFLAEALIGKGEVLWKEGKLSEARNYYRKALALGWKDERVEKIIAEDDANR